MTAHEVDLRPVRGDADVKRPPAHHGLVAAGAIAALDGAKRRLEGIDVLDVAQREA